MWLEIQTYPSISRRTEMENLQETMLFWWLNLVVRCKGLKSFSDRIHVHYHGQSWIPCKAWMCFISCLGYYVYIYIPIRGKRLKKKSSTIYPGFPSLFPYPLISVTLWRSRGTCAVSLPSPLLDASWTSPKVFFPMAISHNSSHWSILQRISNGDFDVPLIIIIKKSHNTIKSGLIDDKMGRKIEGFENPQSCSPPQWRFMGLDPFMGF